MTNTTTTTCEHGDAMAAEVVPCGQPQLWYCETMGGCGGDFTVIKTHSVSRYVTHAATCERKHIPAGWCGCATVKTAGCWDCEKEFPYDVESGPEVTVYE